MSELKKLAKSLKIPFGSKTRKDQLEEMIFQFLQTGIVSKKNSSKIKSCNVDILDLNSFVDDFRNTKET